MHQDAPPDKNMKRGEPALTRPCADSASGKTRVLVLGGRGMLGHKVWQRLELRLDAYATVRSSHVCGPPRGFFNVRNLVAHVDALDFDSVVRALAQVRPQVVVNCIGAVKQVAAARDPLACIELNALFPQRLAPLCQAVGARLIHISTDCVFAGRHGMYTEDSIPDAEDLYGRTKLLGEVASSGCLTLRTSIIGRELGPYHGLVEWFLSQRGGQVRGYTEAVFTGLTTTVLADLIAHLIDKHTELSGLFQVASSRISKHDVLVLLNDAFDTKTLVEPSAEIRIDRSLDGRRFHEATGWLAPSWPDMIAALAADPTPYDEWSRESA